MDTIVVIVLCAATLVIGYVLGAFMALLLILREVREQRARADRYYKECLALKKELEYKKRTGWDVEDVFSYPNDLFSKF